MCILQGHHIAITGSEGGRSQLSWITTVKESDKKDEWDEEPQHFALPLFVIALGMQSFPRPLIRCLVGLVGALGRLTEACASTRLSAVIGARGGW